MRKNCTEIIRIEKEKEKEYKANYEAILKRKWMKKKY
jgi:hypothetical protein